MHAFAFLAAAAAPAQKIGQHAPSTPGIGGALVGLILVLGLILGSIIAFVLHKVLGVGADKAH